MISYIREDAKTLARVNVTEWQWAAECKERGYQCLIRQPGLVIYRIA